ncbi:MAG: radical SAM-superfamily protein [Firmicutes bacterium]|nr:radical SAM-superfamily protein [Bacillota bacterium]
MLLYTAKNGEYESLTAWLQREPLRKTNVYVNLTNQCTCACTFCLRNTKESRESNSLWLKREPSAQEVIAEFAKYDINNFNEIIFCGFGEPTLRLEALLEIANYLKQRNKNISLRINTNGLCELQAGKEIAPLFQGLIDTISISLNASTATEYLRLTRNQFGIQSFDAMLTFAVNCKKYVPHVVLTVVDCIGKTEIAACQALADKLGLTLRVRPFE